MGLVEMMGGCVLIAGTLCVTLASNRVQSAQDSASPMSVNTTGLAPTIGTAEVGSQESADPVRDEPFQVNESSVKRSAAS